MTEAEKQRDAKIKQTAKKSHFVGGWEIEDPQIEVSDATIIKTLQEYEKEETERIKKSQAEIRKRIMLEE